MKVPKRLVLLATAFFLFAAFAGVQAWAQEYSHVRIVRLSFTEGTVTVQRPDVEEWASAPTNTPLQEGFKLQTAEDSFAEAEFENSSTARLGQLSLLEFTQLALAPSGAKVNRLTLHQGYATFNCIPESDDFYEVSAGGATLIPHGKTRFRVDFEQGMTMVKVFKGSVEVMSPEGAGTLGKNTVLEINPGAEEPFLTSQGITKDAWDEWVEEREERVQMAHNAGAPAPYSGFVGDLTFGFMDLLYYGNWVNVPGYGAGWIPAASPGWSPFTAGRWCWYPGFGYTWISYEPWGWLPYHYGAWIYDPVIGWCWIPIGGGAWRPAVVNWYRGPGWVGWAPMSPLLGGTQRHCPHPQGCVIAVNDETFRGGRPIRPDGVRWTTHFDGQPIARPELAPELRARLPGDPYNGIGTSRGGRLVDSTGRMLPGEGRQAERPDGIARGRISPSAPAASAIGSRSSSTDDSGIVFDREQQRYVNNPARPGAPAANPSTDTSSPASGLIGRQPGPRANYPLPPAAGGYGVRPDFGRVPATAPRTTGSENWGTTDREVIGISGSRSAEDHSRGSSSVGSSSSRTAASSSSRSESGSRAGSLVGSSSSRSDGGRSGGSSSGASNSGRSGGWSAGSSSGSSGSSHTSGSGGGGFSGGGSRGSSGGGGGSSSGGHSSSNTRR
jgi:hypothetical protein